MWTLFNDMHRGGGLKEDFFEYIYIEAPEEEAKVIFYNKFGHNPERVSCTCCGEDYSIDTEEELDQLSGYHRGCDYVYYNIKGEEIPSGLAFIPGEGLVKGCHGKYIERKSTGPLSFKKYMPMAEYEKSQDVLFVRSSDINNKEYEGKVPSQGYVWID